MLCECGLAVQAKRMRKQVQREKCAWGDSDAIVYACVCGAAMQAKRVRKQVQGK